MTASTIALGDGRSLRVHEFGDPEGRPVVFLHGGGLGATGLFAACAEQAAREQHLRILAPDRPGMGGSSPCVGRTILDWPRDLTAMADAMQIGTFPVVAHSGGAAFALACARRLQQQVSSVHLASAMAPRAVVSQDPAIPYRTKLGMWCWAKMPDFVIKALFRRISQGMKDQPEKTGQAFLRRLPACEQDVLATPANQAFLRDCVASALQQGPAAVIEDLHLIFGARLQEVPQPVTLWHGEHDATSPPQAARALARRLPRAELHLVPSAGHLTTWVAHTSEILRSL